jgi:hypothetical protein
MTAAEIINSVLEFDDFGNYEQSVYEKYQEIAEKEIVENIIILFSNTIFIQLLKNWGAKAGYKFHGTREISIRLKSGREWKILSPVFLKAKPKKKKGRPPKRRKGVLRHLGLELLGIIKKVSPALIEICVSMAVLCPSFEVAAKALKGIGIDINQNLLQNLTKRFVDLAMNVRVECHSEEVWQKPGIKIQVCVDGGRFRERKAKRGRRKKGDKRQGYHTEWAEPRLLTIILLDENGKKVKSISPIIDGSGNQDIDEFFDLLKKHLLGINIDEASEIVFCADGGPGIWPRINNLISELGLRNAKRILDYTHAKQNMDEVTKITCEKLELPKKDSQKLKNKIKDLLWAGNIVGIIDLVKHELSNKEKTLEAALKKLNGYFGDHSLFQYKKIREMGLPTGSGTVESAIRRIINLRVKGTSIFWKRKNAEKMIFLRSLVLTGKIRNACRKVVSIFYNMLKNNILEELPVIN